MNRPFDAARYAGLLEGLEISIVQKRNLNNELRYEAEYFRKRFLHEDSALSRLPQKALGKFAHVTDGPHGYHVVDEASPIVMLTARNAKDWFTERADADPIATWVDDANKRSSLEIGDVILSTRGTVGLCALVTQEVLPANIDQDVARISWKDRDSFPPGFIVAYLNSSYGQDHFARYSSGMVQQGMSLSKVREIPIPLLSQKTSVAIAGMVQSALDSRRRAAAGKLEAEQVLLRALDLEHWHPPEPLSYVRSSRDAFAAGRLDAEYFAPRVIELLGRLGQHGQRIRDVAPARHERFIATATGTFDYIEIGNLRADGTATAEPTEQSDAPSRATWHVHAGDIVTSMVRPIRRLSALIAPEQDGSVCSSGFVVLEPQAVPPEVLLAYLRLPPVCELMDLHTSASLYPAIAETDLLALPFPHIDAGVQGRIVASVQAAQAGRQRAVDLLDAAKRAVEIAIEDSEIAALRYLASFNLPANTAS